MQNTTSTIFETQFQEDVYNGLTNFPKQLSSKYFYDELGDKLFQDIMKMPEYYLTNSEYNIINNHKQDILKLLTKNTESFNLVELGAGDGKKTKILLKHFSENKVNFKYQPIDISNNALSLLKKSLENELPLVNVETFSGSYFNALEKIDTIDSTKKIILFLGSNIGNLSHDDAILFLKRVRDFMGYNDLFFVGFDLKKNPQKILNAYNDATGITEAFNKNILARINRELNADFNLNKFLHWEVYNPETGVAKSYLVSKELQSITIKKLDLRIKFKEWETIHTEISQKYDDEIIKWLADEAGLTIETQFSDSENQYKNFIFKK